jgi:hypothetical protein
MCYMNYTKHDDFRRKEALKTRADAVTCCLDCHPVSCIPLLLSLQNIDLYF